jgi:mRNA interferase MazF
VERPVLVPRPALVLTSMPVGPDGLLLWTLMITNAARPEWPGDVIIKNAEALGLLIPSKIRTAKVASVETASAVLLGRLDDDGIVQICDLVRGYLPA